MASSGKFDGVDFSQINVEALAIEELDEDHLYSL
jgi:hypothetical protein